jgi:hypothetical protein
MSAAETLQALASLSPGDAKRLLVDALSRASRSRKRAARRLGISKQDFDRLSERLSAVSPAPPRR